MIIGIILSACKGLSSHGGTASVMFSGSKKQCVVV